MNPALTVLEPDDTDIAGRGTCPHCGGTGRDADNADAICAPCYGLGEHIEFFVGDDFIRDWCGGREPDHGED